MLFGGFTNSKTEIVDIIQKLIDEQITEFDASELSYQQKSDNPNINKLEAELIDTRFRLGQEYLVQGKKELALQEFELALAFDRENLIIRKQIWVLKYPEKFHPVVDYAWQKEQLIKERAEEEKTQNECGPDGCKIE